MRKIKFRAWDKKLERYIKRSDLRDPFHISVKPTQSGFALKTTFILEQFIGRRDMKGREIYEGDIDKAGGYVIWNPKFAGFCLKDTVGKGKCDDISLADSESWFLIVGNIRQNPDLLKTENKK